MVDQQPKRGHFSDRSCSGPGFINGTARGHRTFFLDTDGLLRGLTYRQVWVPGENVAECMVTDRRAGVMSTRAHGYTVAGVSFPHGPTGTTPQLLPGVSWDRCDGLASDCSCGFYAYHDERRSFTVAFSGPAGGWGQMVPAVVEGYGKVILGPKGYRASKARIIAIALAPLPTADLMVAKRRYTLERLRADAQALLDEPYTRACRGAILGLIATAGLIGIAGFTANSAYLNAAATTLTAAMVIEVASRADMQKSKRELQELIDCIDADLARAPDTLAQAQDRLCENYPDVPIYMDAKTMLGEWPVTSLAYLVGEGAGE